MKPEPLRTDEKEKRREEESLAGRLNKQNPVGMDKREAKAFEGFLKDGLV